MSQFIDGKTCDALSGKSDVVRDPSTGEVVAEITLAGAEDVDRAVQAARNAYAEWSRATPADRSAVLTTFARLLSDRAEEIAQLESRIAGKPIRLATRVRRAGHDRQRRVLRRRRPQPRGQGDRGVLRRPHLLDPARTRRRGRVHLAVELSAADGRVEDPAGDRGRQHHRAEAVGAHAADQPAVRRDRHRGRPPAGRGERAHRHGRGLRRGAAPPSRRRHGVVHRLDPGRPDGAGGRGHERQAGSSRARRQGPVRGLRRRRPDRGDPRSRGRQLDQHRPGLHGRDPGDRAPLALRRVRRRSRRPLPHPSGSDRPPIRRPTSGP